MNNTGPITFITILVGFVLIIAGHNFVRYYIAKDYPLHVFTSCNTSVHDCFVADPEVADPTFQGSPYAKLEINAASAPKCLDEHSCVDFSCSGLSNCQITYCSQDTKEDGETCSSENKQNP